MIDFSQLMLEGIEKLRSRVLSHCIIQNRRLFMLSIMLDKLIF